MTGPVREYILPDTDIGTLSVLELLRHTQNGSFIEKKNFSDIYPLALELNAGVFTKTAAAVGFPNVSVSRRGSSLVSSCSCEHEGQKLCEHQAEIIYCLLEERNYRIFFDHALRHKTLLERARGYGLEAEPNLDAYFRLTYTEGKLHVETRVKELLAIDGQMLRKTLIPPARPVVTDLAARETGKRPVLVISRHRYYNHLNFLLMEAEVTQTGKIKNPVSPVDPAQRLWKTDNPAELRFYAAMMTFRNQQQEDPADAVPEALRQITANPLNLEVYYHDRGISEAISARSLVVSGLNVLNAEIQLTVFKKEPFYEVTGELLFNDISLPFKNVVFRNDYFVLHQQVFHLISHPDLLRVVRFFKANHEILLVHASKYDEFLQTVLAPLEQLVHINYSYIRRATPAQLAEKSFQTERIIYLQQEGNFVSLTPVMKYGSREVPVYSRKQLRDTDQNGNEFTIERDNEAEARLTALIMSQHPEFREQIKEHHYFYLHKDKFLDEQWFLDAFDVWREEGVTILGFNKLEKNTLNPHRAKVSVTVNSGTDWFNARLKVRFGDKEASLKQVYRAIRNKSRFVQLDNGTRGILPAEWIRKIAGYFRLGEIDEELLKIPKVNFSEVEELFEKEVLSGQVQHEIAAYRRQLSLPVPEVPVPAALQAELRHYQREGLSWLSHLDNLNFGGCLADDMGLGKTLQIIALILLKREKYGPATHLVVAPTSLLFNWQEELEKFAPSLKVGVHHGAGRQKHTEGMHHNEVVLTSYGTMMADIRFLKTFRFDTVFLDESQAIKNPGSERYKAACLLQSRNRIVLTGTPVENNTFDLYGQLSFACPGLLGSRLHFREIYSTPIDKFESSRRAFELRQKISPFILRRTKRQVEQELPEKTEMVIYCEMNAEQRRVYDACERELREFISVTDEEEIRKNSMHVLKGLTRLRQICNSPVLLKEGYPGENAVKIDVLSEQIVNTSKEHKILVFSQFVGMLELIRAELEERDIPFEYLTGQTKDRGAKVRNFRTDAGIRVFLISLKAGGVGLNLTEADYVYLVDPWWNPAAENQAIDRVHRIGQDKKVVAVRLICSGTLEEKIMHLQQKKSRLARDLVRTNADFLNGLSKSELLEIL
ncbi:DEAD/DEAH box helicase [Leadbetterella sp. DM7]|uniref:DEAD/DEAH box helicase n=1 Tax=Leadbetterella sp. DM7 TaxID=3235085 RepID=UPI00349E8F7D